jgi:hypothetical protein
MCITAILYPGQQPGKDVQLLPCFVNFLTFTFPCGALSSIRALAQKPRPGLALLRTSERPIMKLRPNPEKDMITSQSAMPFFPFACILVCLTVSFTCHALAM